MDLIELKNKILNGYKITAEEAYELIEQPLAELKVYANEIREHFCKNKFDLCSIINAKSGKCSENCKYCAQSSFYDTQVEVYDLLKSDIIVKEAIENRNKGVLRFSIVTSGRKPSKKDLNRICEIIYEIKQNSDVEVCASLGLLNKEDLQKLKSAGLTRIHNNLESSENYFKQVCTTHTTQDKIQTIKYAQELGIDVCSGGISGLGENWRDRVELALMLRDLNIMSIPLNFLCAIKGTPYENNKLLNPEEILRICAIFRFVNPKAFIRLAGGRYLTEDNGEECLKSGINSLITGDMLTTTGTTIASDLKMVKEFGFEVKI